MGVNASRQGAPATEASTAAGSAAARVGWAAAYLVYALAFAATFGLALRRGLLSASLLVPWAAPSGGLDVRCDARRVLVGPLAGDGRARPSLVGFPEGRSPTHAELEVPTSVLARASTLHALALVDDGVAAVVSNEGAARVFRWSQGRWSPGGYLATLRPALDTTRAVTRMVARAEGDDLALWVRGVQVQRRRRPPAQNAEPDAPPVFDETRAGFDVVMRSRDGGRTFTTL